MQNVAPRHRHGLRVAHKIAHQIDDVHAEIDQGAAARARFVAEPPARVAVAAHIGGARIIEIAEIAVRGKVAYKRRVAREPPHESDLQHALVFNRGLPHLFGLRRVHGHRLLAQHVFAGVKRGDRRRRVGAVPGAHADDVDLGHFCQHLVVVGEQILDAVLFPALFEHVGIDVAERDEIHVGMRDIIVDMVDGDSAHADYGGFQFFHG